MASRSPYLPRLSLSGNASSTLPTHHQHSQSEEYDLPELSPRPSSPLLASDHVRDTGLRNATIYNERGNSNSSGQRGKTKAVAYADLAEVFPPLSVVDRNRIRRERKAATGGNQPQVAHEEGTEQTASLSVPPSSADYRDDVGPLRRQQMSPQPRQGQSRSLGASFVGFLNLEPSTAGSDSVGDVDHTFRIIERREKQIQKELQRLLDAQTYALEQGEALGHTSQDSSNIPREKSHSSSIPDGSRHGYSYEHFPAPVVVPVRQPKPNPPTARQVRTSIARSMALLSDLKEEEHFHITAAVSIRENALARVNKLSNQHKTIAAELRVLENGDPLQNELESMSNEYSKVCADITEHEGKLRALKHQKRVLESRVEEVKSKRESGLSGYRNALRETERDIGEIMRMPGVAILPLETDAHILGISESDAAAQDGLLERALNGYEFMRMRPERRTIAMVKEWWEGEVALLLRRKDDVDKERDALFAGSEIWAQTMQIIVDYEKRLGLALSDSIQVRPTERHKLEADVFRAQYYDLLQTIKKVESKLHHVERRGWNLLVAAIGAELDGFLEGEKILAGLLKVKGYEPSIDSELVEVDEDQATAQNMEPNGLAAPAAAVTHDDGLDDELSRSVVRRWGGQSETKMSPRASDGEDALQPINSPPTIARNDNKDDQDHKDESDNEVPADLLVSKRHLDESEDEHANEVPSEFLSMHDSSPANEGKHAGKEMNDHKLPQDLTILGDIAAAGHSEVVD